MSRSIPRETPAMVEVHIRARSGWRLPDFRELWQYRELMYVLSWRDIKVRYKQTVLGIAWAIMQPVLAMVVFTIFFGNLAKVPSDGIPYPLFSLTALVPWTFFSNAMTQAATSVVDSGQLIGKVFFPRTLVPVATVLSNGVDFGLSLVVLGGLMLWYRRLPGIPVLLLPFLVLLTFATAMGVGFWLAALNVQFRDVRYAVPFLAQLWLFATPVVYPSSLLHAPWRTLFALNPMVGVIDGFRWALLGRHGVPTASLVVSSAVSVALLISGTLYYNRVEARFADLI